jgi:Fe-S cluster assembly iron-binding protein IscA
MIRLTERAAYGLREILTANRTPSDQGVKLVPNESGGVAMTMDRPQEGDSVVDGGKRPLLIVDAAIAPRLEGIVLDFSRGEKDGEEAQFILRPAESTSGSA